MYGVTKTNCECGHPRHVHGDRAIIACIMRVDPAHPYHSYTLSVPCPCQGWKPTTLD